MLGIWVSKDRDLKAETKNINKMQLNKDNIPY
jgi:hypothetical protein